MACPSHRASELRAAWQAVDHTTSGVCGAARQPNAQACARGVHRPTMAAHNRLRRHWHDKPPLRCARRADLETPARGGAPLTTGVGATAAHSASPLGFPRFGQTGHSTGLIHPHRGSRDTTAASAMEVSSRLFGESGESPLRKAGKDDFMIEEFERHPPESFRRVRNLNCLLSIRLEV